MPNLRFNNCLTFFLKLRLDHSFPSYADTSKSDCCNYCRCEILTHNESKLEGNSIDDVRTNYTFQLHSCHYILVSKPAEQTNP